MFKRSKLVKCKNCNSIKEESFNFFNITKDFAFRRNAIFCDICNISIKTCPTIYNIVNYPEFLRTFFDPENFSKLLEYKIDIIRLLKDELIFNNNTKYKLISAICYTFYNHFTTIIFSYIGDKVNDILIPIMSFIMMI